MKHLLSDILRTRIEKLCLSVSAESIHHVAESVLWLAPAAEQLGFTRFADPAEFTRQIALPAIDLMPHLPEEAVSLAEVGPGSGGAGLTLAALNPRRTIHLIDRRKRVCAFLKVAAARLNLDNARTHCADIQGLAENAMAFDVILSRAVAPPVDILPPLLCAVRDGGIVALYHSTAKVPDLPNARLMKEIQTAVSNLTLFVFAKQRSI